MTTRSSIVRSAALVLLASSLLVAVGCRREPGVQSRLVVHGGPSLDPLFAELASVYRATHPQVDLVCEFSCPPCVILKRDGVSQDMDLFASLGQFELDTLHRDGGFTFPASRVLGTTGLVLVTSQRLKSPVHSIADLLRSSTFRVGMGDPKTVGVGYYAEQALRKSGLWGELEGRLVLSQSGCELLKWLGLGRDIEAALVFDVCVTPGDRRLDRVHGFPSEVIAPVPLILAQPTSAVNPQEAARFMEFCAGPEAAPLLARYNVKPQSASTGAEAADD